MTPTLSSRLLGLAAALGLGYLAFDYAETRGEANHAVAGRVQVAGRPLTEGRVVFIGTADSSSRAKGAGAFVTNGAYTLDQEDGLPAGKYLVQISGIGQSEPVKPVRRRNSEDDPRPTREEPLPARFNRESGIVVEVTPESGVVGFDFDLK